MLKFRQIITTIVPTLMLASWLLLSAIPAQSQPADSNEMSSFVKSDWSIMLFGGQMSRNAFGRTLNPFAAQKRMDIFLTGAAANKNLYRGKFFDIEAEAGIAYQFSDSLPGNDSPQVWGALYLRYKYFPWNKLDGSINRAIAADGLICWFLKPHWS